MSNLAGIKDEKKGRYKSKKNNAFSQYNCRIRVRKQI